ncbi:hypothetical protein HJC23_009777 [Cyclotella cryptica]|uniref:Uncharacterized protein n=1 Tax=Cyclotella cryptica TaxID=29204 RepID=A0ABD3PRT5_9STRA|eukprot:CCRYP_012128-RA/>CCRYP_012128-RA protein AED:0.08 eAED:0.08 QI:0/-1/0/1/-1/1/1/0/305
MISAARSRRTAPGLVFLLLRNSLAFFPCQRRQHIVVPRQRTNLRIQHPTPNTFALLSTQPRIDDSESNPEAQLELFWRARQDCWRPDVRDVEKISWGMPAKKKGTGSRGIPHRLNEDERRAFDQARRQGFLQVKGSSWRSQRRDAPLLNTYRSLMDALGRPAIVLHKLNPSSIDAVDGEDVLVVDISPLRYPDEFGRVAQKVKDVVLQEMQVEGQVALEESQPEDEEDEMDNLQTISDDTMYETRPIYQLPPYSINFKVTRQQGKEVGKLLAAVFETMEEKAAPSKKPKGIKPGKSRRSGGYGIG